MKIALCFLAFLLPLSATQASLIAVPGFNNVLRAVSDNGVATGGKFRWDPINGHTDLGYLPGPGSVNIVEANGISADGSTIVGTSTNQDGPSYLSKAFIWTSSSGMQPLQNLSIKASAAASISLDGRIVAGTVTTTDSTSHAVLWTDGAETLRLHSGTGASALSRNGLWIGGAESAFWGDNAFIWSQETGLERILISNVVNSYQVAIHAITDNGNVAIGSYSQLSGPRPFRWSRSGGFQSLSWDGSGFASGWAFGLNADGSIMVGTMNNSPFYWTETDGMRPLADVLEDDYFIDLTGWTLGGATGISADGKTIYGFGQLNGQQMNFIATVPEPSFALLFTLGVAMQLGLIRRRHVSASNAALQ